MDLAYLTNAELKVRLKILLEKYNENSLISENEFYKYEKLQKEELKKWRLSLYTILILLFSSLGLLINNTSGLVVLIIRILFFTDIILLISFFIVVYLVLPLLNYTSHISYRLRFITTMLLYVFLSFPIISLIKIYAKDLNLTPTILVISFAYILFAILLNLLQTYLDNRIYSDLEFDICQKKYWNDKYYEDLFKYTIADHEEVNKNKIRYAKRIQLYKEELKKRCKSSD